MKLTILITAAVVTALCLPQNAQAYETSLVANSNLKPMVYVAPEKPVVVQEVRRTAPPRNTTVGNEAVRQVSSQANGLTGRIGAALFTGRQCTELPGLNRDNGNAIQWRVLYSQPAIGRTALFTYNHVGLVVGIHSNGDLEIFHDNYKGSQHRFPPSAFRGYR